MTRRPRFLGAGFLLIGVCRQTMEKLLTIPSDYWSCYGKYTESAYTPVYKPKRSVQRPTKIDLVFALLVSKNEEEKHQVGRVFLLRPRRFSLCFFLFALFWFFTSKFSSFSGTRNEHRIFLLRIFNRSPAARFTCVYFFCACFNAVDVS